MSEAVRRKIGKSPKLPSRPPDDAFDEALAEAQDQVEAMTGNWDTPVRLRLIDQRHDVPKEKRRHAIQLCGSLGDEDFCRKLWGFNCDGYDVYVVAQGTCRLGPASLGLPADEPINQKHITQGRIIVADFDDKDFPREDWYWHIPPTFILRRENSDRHFWAVWCTEIYDPRSIRDIHKGRVR